MNFMQFSNYESMQAYLIQAKADADAQVHQAQRAITYGDHWVRFIDIANRVVEFGRVYTLDEVKELEYDAGATAEEARMAVTDTETGMQGNFMYGWAASLHYPAGESGYSHKSVVWPIEESLFTAAKDAQWNIDLLPLSAKVNLEVAFIAYRGRGK